MVWKPHVTVAAIIEKDDQFLLVEEEQGLPETVFNQPAGHLDEGESLISAAIRETMEETAHTFIPTAIVGIYRWIEPKSGTTYLRICFCGQAKPSQPGQPLDDGIVAARWFAIDEINALSHRLRSPLVKHCIDDYLAGKRYPLELLTDLGV